jgi:hypothetical protein
MRMVTFITFSFITLLSNLIFLTLQASLRQGFGGQASSLLGVYC